MFRALGIILAILMAAPAVAFAQDVVCSADGKQYAFEDMVKFAKEDGTEKTFPSKYAKALGIVTSGDLLVYRLGSLDPETKIFRALDVPRQGGDAVLFVRVEDLYI